MAGKLISDALKSFNENYAAKRLSEEITTDFIKKLMLYRENISKAVFGNENEEHIKNITNYFLRTAFYSDEKYQINTSSYIDSSIKCDDKLLAFMEIKKPTNKAEMVKIIDINKKALWEIIYYFLTVTRDVSGSKVARVQDSEIRRIIITDTQLWVVIDSIDLEKICDGYIERHFYKYKNNQLSYANDNAKFYEDLKIQLEKIDITKILPFIYFELDEVIKTKRNCQQLFKLLSHEFLFKDGFKKDITTNILNEKFYQELLYIMGLVETKGKNNTVIEIDSSIKNSFAEQVYSKYINDKDKKEQEAIEKTFELIIIWMNRLLFIKLFEGQLVTFNDNSRCYHILDADKIKSFDDLQNLFFNVLGKKERDDSSFYNQFSEIPYLNSSLFERQEIERDDININELRNGLIEKKSRSVLGNKDIKKITILEYLIEFLNIYTFSSQLNEDDLAKHNDIIDANVLGLIFEKINGYKDGSVYTPSSITNYMSKITIERVVLNKINENFGWKCLSFDDIKFNITSLQIARQINSVINTLKICDPAVGSGHFLVSVLNRIIAIKAALGVLFKTDKQERLSEVDIFIEDDVLCITNAQGVDFKYEKNIKYSQEVQETLFNEKKIIIEECLFGVDLNPKAVYICQLRLWIELLKNAYYKNQVMQTLPNIDINIKVGNSLISKLDFEVNKKIVSNKTDVDSYTKKLLDQYKEAVKKYKSVSDKNEKQKIKAIIMELKASIYQIYIQLTLFDTKDSDNFALYENAFEWAFEFPEIISEDGIYLGFDAILGNPPYGLINKKQNQVTSISAVSKQMEYYKNSEQYRPAKGGMLNIYRLFICRSYKLLKKNGYCSLIFPIAFMCDLSSTQIRRFLFNNTKLEYIEAFPERDDERKRVFQSAKMSVCIMGFCKSKPNKNHYINLRINNDRYIDISSTITRLSLDDVKQIDMQSLTIPLTTQSELDLLIKITIGSQRCIEYSKCYTGEIDLALDKKYITLNDEDAPMLRGAQVQKYRITNNISQGDILYLKSNEYLINNNSPRSEHHNYRRIVMQGITGVNEKNRLKMSIAESPYFCANSVNYLILNSENENLEYMLGLLNSKVLNWFFSKLSTNSNVNGYEIDNLPIKDTSAELKIKITSAVKNLLNYSEDAEKYINLIDNAVFEIYNLNKGDISILLGE